MLFYFKVMYKNIFCFVWRTSILKLNGIFNISLCSILVQKRRELIYRYCKIVKNTNTLWIFMSTIYIFIYSIFTHFFYLVKQKYNFSARGCLESQSYQIQNTNPDSHQMANYNSSRCKTLTLIHITLINIEGVHGLGLIHCVKPAIVAQQLSNSFLFNKS